MSLAEPTETLKVGAQLLTSSTACLTAEIAPSSNKPKPAIP